jgi:capsular exopolysaccharide synthesis family protein
MSQHLRNMQVEQNGHKKPKKQVSIEFVACEQLRLLAMRIDQLSRQRTLRVLGVTSTMAGEGKTTIATNLAIVTAKLFEKKTLLIDCDFRRPAIAKLLNCKSEHGLLEVLKGQVTPAVARWQVMNKLLTVLPLVKPDVDGATLFSNPEVRARFREVIEGFDCVIIDTPPALPLADTNLLAELFDGFLFVVKAEQTPRRLIASAVKNLPQDKLLGFVLNNTAAFGRAAYDYHYYGRGYY